MNQGQFNWGRWVASFLALGGVALVFVNLLIDVMPKGTPPEVEGYVAWEKETIKLAETLPIQSGGRVKPLSTYASFTMLGVHGARSMKVSGNDGEEIKLSPTEWMMDALFRPQFAVKHPTFRVDNSDVLTAVGIEAKGRRDRYTYAEIEPGRKQLIERAQTFEAMDKDDRDPVQQQTIDLAYNLRNFESFLGYFGFARFGVELTGSGAGERPDQRAALSSVMMTAPQLRSELSRSQSEGGQIDSRLQALLEQVLDAANFGRYGLFVIPLKDATDRVWLSAGNAIMAVMTQEASDPELLIEDVKIMETMVTSLARGEEQFRTEFGVFKERVEKRAESRGEMHGLQMEVAYYRADWFLYAMVFFLLGTMGAFGMWAANASGLGKALTWFTWGTTSVATIICVVAMVKRSLIMMRPPVANLYDTIIFIGTTGVILCLIIEWMVKRRFALGLAPILGTALILLARRYEVGDAKDHMDPLVAVLDSNFWLATHVTTITLGYSAGFLAAFLSCGYLLMRGLGLDNGDKDLRRALSRAVYGSICLTLFLSLVGTVLGGIWANYSWGRFWGWDPKENGALMIVLWTLAILHARLGGLIHEWGLHLASVFTACIVTFSWWHVNFLGVGLHNYGFTAGKGTIWFFYGVMMIFIIFGFIAMVWEQSRREVAKVRKATEVPGLGAES